MGALARLRHNLLAKPEPEFYHSPDYSSGFFAILVRDREWHRRLVEYHRANGASQKNIENLPQLKQTMHRVTDIAKVVRELEVGRDSYISQAAFAWPRDASGKYFRPNRRAVNVLRLPLSFVDLDMRIGPAQVDYFVKDILDTLEEEGFPLPSFILFSGRGLHLKWLYKTPLPRMAAPRWNAVQKHLVGWFSRNDWCVDAGASDISRVLRVEGTVNEKSGENCSVVWADLDGFGMVETVDFESLADHVLPLGREEFRSKVRSDYLQQGLAWKAKKSKRRALAGSRNREGGHRDLIGSQSGLNFRQLGWDRLHDLRRLAALRGAVPHDQTAHREVLIFWAVNFGILSGAFDAFNVVAEARALAQEMFPGPWAERHDFRWVGHLGSLQRRAKEFSEQTAAEILANKKGKKGLLKASNNTLIEQLHITLEEQRELQTIISRDVKNERRTEKRRKEGVRPAERVHADAQARRERVHMLRSEGKTGREIAEIEGITAARVSQILKS